MADSQHEYEWSRESIPRRHFFAFVGSGALAVTFSGAGVLTWQYLSPNLLLEPATSFKAGRPEAYPPDSVTLLKEQKVFIVRAPEGYFYALSAICTHLGCITQWRGEEGMIACPCHGSRFNRDGAKIEGPAPRPLVRVLITLNEAGELVVDRGLQVPDDQILKV